MGWVGSRSCESIPNKKSHVLVILPIPRPKAARRAWQPGMYEEDVSQLHSQFGQGQELLRAGGWSPT